MIKIIYEKHNNRSAAYDSEKIIGECSYVDYTTYWVLNHTHVDHNYNGQGIAGKLVKELVEQARIKGIKIKPVCSFVIREFNKKEEYKDVLK